LQEEGVIGGGAVIGFLSFVFLFFVFFFFFFYFNYFILIYIEGQFYILCLEVKI